LLPQSTSRIEGFRERCSTRADRFAEAFPLERRFSKGEITIDIAWHAFSGIMGIWLSTGKKSLALLSKGLCVDCLASLFAMSATSY
jgi:hypothetical protein